MLKKKKKRKENRADVCITRYFQIFQISILVLVHNCILNVTGKWRMFRKMHKSPSLACMHCFLLLRGKFRGKKKNEFSIGKCLQQVMNSCELVFRQHYHCKNNRLTTGKPQDTARRNDRQIWHSSAKHVKENSKIKKLGCYCFCKSWFRPICPLRRLPPGRCPDVVEWIFCL